MKQVVDGGGKRVPVATVFFPCAAAAWSQLIVSALVARFRDAPGAGDESLPLQMAKDVVERSVAPEDGVAGSLKNASPDLVAVGGPGAQQVENNQVVGARQQILGKLIDGCRAMHLSDMHLGSRGGWIQRETRGGWRMGAKNTFR